MNAKQLNNYGKSCLAAALCVTLIRARKTLSEKSALESTVTWPMKLNLRTQFNWSNFHFYRPKVTIAEAIGWVWRRASIHYLEEQQTCSQIWAFMFLSPFSAEMYGIILSERFNKVFALLAGVIQCIHFWHWYNNWLRRPNHIQSPFVCVAFYVRFMEMALF